MDSSRDNSILGGFEVEDSKRILNPLPHGSPDASDIEYLPYLEKVIEHLDKVFPLRRTDETATDREIWIMSGCRKCIDYLQDHLDRQNEELMSNHSVLEGLRQGK
jgi:hypothetical protein